MQSTNNIFMPVILHIETSTNVCSVTLSENGKILFEKIDVQNITEALSFATNNKLI